VVRDAMQFRLVCDLDVDVPALKSMQQVYILYPRQDDFSGTKYQPWRSSKSHNIFLNVFYAHLLYNTIFHIDILMFLYLS